MYKIKVFREIETCVCNSFRTDFSFSRLLISCYLSMCFLSCTIQLMPKKKKKTATADFRYKSLQSWKIDDVDFTQQKSLDYYLFFIDWLMCYILKKLLTSGSVSVTKSHNWTERESPGRLYGRLCRTRAFCVQRLPWPQCYLSSFQLFKQKRWSRGRFYEFYRCL